MFVQEEFDRNHATKFMGFFRVSFASTVREEAKNNKIQLKHIQEPQVNSCYDIAAKFLKKQCRIQNCWGNIQLDRAGWGRKPQILEGK